MQEGRVIPFLGAGANRCGRSEGESWQHGEGRYLPDGRELADHLAEYFGYPAGEARELLRVSQYATVMQGAGPLYIRLHEVFDTDFPPNALHALLASLPAAWRDKKCEQLPFQLIVTTNYDDVLERAFTAAGESFDLLSYIAAGPDRGRFLHIPPSGRPKLVKRPNQYPLSLDERTIILKVHGAVNRSKPLGKEDSYVISEDNYIDLLSQSSVTSLIPVMLNAHMQSAHFLFLGYSMRDWNVRVILRRIWGEQPLDFRSWSIQRDPDTLEREFWPKRNVDIYDVDLADYVRMLDAAIHALPPCGGGR
jgi:hypothetical protein